MAPVIYTNISIDREIERGLYSLGCLARHDSDVIFCPMIRLLYIAAGVGAFGFERAPNAISAIPMIATRPPT